MALGGHGTIGTESGNSSGVRGGDDEAQRDFLILKAHVSFGLSKILDELGIMYFLVQEKPAWRCFGKTSENEWECEGAHLDLSGQFHSPGLDHVVRHTSYYSPDGYHEWIFGSRSK